MRSRLNRVAEVRLADCFRNGYEVHLKSGAGDLDFAAVFRRLEDQGFAGHYMNAFGSLDDMLAGRDSLLQLALKAGISAQPTPGRDVGPTCCRRTR